MIFELYIFFCLVTWNLYSLNSEKMILNVFDIYCKWYLSYIFFSVWLPGIYIARMVKTILLIVFDIYGKWYLSYLNLLFCCLKLVYSSRVGYEGFQICFMSMSGMGTNSEVGTSQMWDAPPASWRQQARRSNALFHVLEMIRVCVCFHIKKSIHVHVDTPRVFTFLFGSDYAAVSIEDVCTWIIHNWHDVKTLARH